MAGWSLRRRLIAGILALLAVVCLGIGAVSAVAVRQFLIDRLDGALAAAADRAEGPLRFGGPAGRPLEAQFPPGQTIGTISYLARPDGSASALVLTERGPEPLTERQLAELAAVPVDGRAHPATVDDLGEYRANARSVSGYTLVTALPVAAVQETVWRLVLIEAAVAGTALVLAAGAGTLIVGGALSPLRRVTAAARRVTELPLAHGDVELRVRVPPHQTDTRTEVGQLGAAFNRMLGHVGDALAARHASELRVRQFVADASHELRTPLAAIRGYAEMTRRTPAGAPSSRAPTAAGSGHGALPSDVAHALARIEAESRRMTMLVDDLLLLARLDSGRPLEREPVELSQLVVDAVSDAHAAGPDHAWQLLLPDAPVTLTGDEARLQQVIGNLLTNARMHTPAGTTVTTSLAVADGHAVLTVDDDGPGIAAELRDEIFERFVRGDTARSRDRGGTGLGLSIVAAVVASHAGQVRIESPPSRGSRFVVQLPGAALRE